jgi:hypothetical protein
MIAYTLSSDVGQTIAFCRLSTSVLWRTWQTTINDGLPHLPLHW